MERYSAKESAENVTSRGRMPSPEEPKQKRQKIQVMQASNLTQEERRRIRRDLVAHGEEIRAIAPEIGASDGNKFSEIMEKSGELFEKVKYPREAACDVSNLRDIAAISLKQANDLKSKSMSFSQVTFIEKLREKFSSDTEEFDWSKFGKLVGVCVRSVPKAHFMLGALEKPQKIRAPVVRQKPKQDTEAVEVRLKSLEEGAMTKEQKDPTQKRLHTMSNVFRKQGNSAKIDFAKAFINPESFTQTVENIFDFTYFVKAGSGGIFMDEEEGSLTVGPMNPNDDTDFKAKQTVLTFTKDDCNRLIEDFGLKGQDPMMPARPTGPNSDYYDPLSNNEE